MTSGARVVLAMLGGTLAIALLAVAAFLLTDEGNLRCVEGELQDNAVRADGTFAPRQEHFATIEEAEAFVCKRIPHPRDTGVLSLREVEVLRSTNLGSLIEGKGSASISLYYVTSPQAEPPFGVQVIFPSQGVPRVDLPSDTIRVGGHDAVLVRSEQGAKIYWSAGGFDFAAGGSLDLEKMIAILESVR